LYSEWEKTQGNFPLWLENESQRIGDIHLNNQLFEQMQDSPIISVQVSREERVEHLMTSYGVMDAEVLKGSLYR
jgi:tRNA 2-selenouridine synthase